MRENILLASLAIAEPVAGVVSAAVTKKRIENLQRVNEQNEEKCGNDKAEADNRPCRRPLTGMKLQQEKARQTENHCRDGEEIDESVPDHSGVPAFVQIVEICDPAAVGYFVGDRVATAIDAQPCVATGPGQGDVNFLSRPFGVAS